MNYAPRRNKNFRRPGKGPKGREKRDRVQRRRLVGLGVPVEIADRLNSSQLREFLRRPKDIPKLLKRYQPAAGTS
jgi:hypothetical protein